MNDLRDLIEDVETRVQRARERLSAITIQEGREDRVANPRQAVRQIEDAMAALNEAARRIDHARLYGIVPR